MDTKINEMNAGKKNPKHFKSDNSRLALHLGLKMRLFSENLIVRQGFRI